MSRSRYVLGGALVAAAVSAASIAPSTAHTARPAAASKRVAKALWAPDAPVRAITLSKKRVYIAGDFGSLKNTTTGRTVTRTRVAAFRRDNGALVKGFHPTLNGSVDALAVLGHKLFVGGDFSTVQGASRQNLAAVNKRSGALTSVVAQVDGPVWALLAMQGTVYAGGDFEHVGTDQRTHLFALDTHGALSTTWPDQSAGTTKGGVYSLAATADQRAVIVGGAFDKLVGQARSWLGEVSASSGDVLAWSPAQAPQCSSHCFVVSLAVDGSTVYAGVAGPGGNVVAYRQSNASIAWSRHTDGDVTAIALDGRYVIAGGHFFHVNHRPHRMFAQLVAKTGRVTSRHPAVTGKVFPGILALAVHDRRISVGGAFNTFAGQKFSAILPQ
jgi:outer membrane protein assembly factor BamB